MYYLLSFILGTAIGSFLNVVIYRLPKEQKLTGRSHCPNCHNQLSGFELIPLLSFLWLKGKCKNCKTQISTRYFLVEFLTGILFLGSFCLILPVSLSNFSELVRLWYISALLVVIFFIDLDHFLILDVVIFPAILAVSILNIFLDGLTNNFNPHGYFLSGLLAALVGGLFFFIIWAASRGRWMGFGDVKFALLLGVMVGWPLILLNIFLAFLLGAFISIFLLLGGKKTLKSAVPFGVFLSPAAVITLIWGPKILTWYLALIGLRGYN